MSVRAIPDSSATPAPAAPDKISASVAAPTQIPLALPAEPAELQNKNAPHSQTPDAGYRREKCQNGQAPEIFPDRGSPPPSPQSPPAACEFPCRPVRNPPAPTSPYAGSGFQTSASPLPPTESATDRRAAAPVPRVAATTSA